MPFIIAKTVTYVSSLTVTYVTTLYIPAARQVMFFEPLDEWYQVAGRYGFAQPGIGLGVVPHGRLVAAPTMAERKSDCQTTVCLYAE